MNAWFVQLRNNEGTNVPTNYVLYGKDLTSQTARNLAVFNGYMFEAGLTHSTTVELNKSCLNIINENGRHEVRANLPKEIDAIDLYAILNCTDGLDVYAGYDALWCTLSGGVQAVVCRCDSPS